MGQIARVDRKARATTVLLLVLCVTSCGGAGDSTDPAKTQKQTTTGGTGGSSCPYNGPHRTPTTLVLHLAKSTLLPGDTTTATFDASDCQGPIGFLDYVPTWYSFDTTVVVVSEVFGATSADYYTNRAIVTARAPGAATIGVAFAIQAYDTVTVTAPRPPR